MFLHLHSTKNYTQTCRPAVHNCYDWGRPVVAGGWRARIARGISFEGECLSLVGFSGLYIVFLLSVPLRPQYTAPCSHTRSLAFSLDFHPCTCRLSFRALANPYTHRQAHTQARTHAYSFLSISLSPSLSFPRSLPRLSIINSSDLFSF